MRPEPRDTHDPYASARRRLADGDAAGALSTLRTAGAPAGEGVSPAPWAGLLVEVARAAEEGGDAATAEDALTLALTRVNWADLHCRVGVLRARRGDASGARLALDRAIALNPRYRAAVLERALLDAREGRIAEAVGALRSFEGADSTALAAGLERLRAQAVDDAAPLLREALQGGDVRLRDALATVERHVAAGEGAAALAVLRSLVRERPEWPDLLARLGALELREGLVDDGIATLSEALELNPDYHAARLELALGLEARGEREVALAQVQALLAAAPGYPGGEALLERLAPRQRTMPDPTV
jgi:tetratricopeptide (TPR) repeat protein